MDENEIKSLKMFDRTKKEGSPFKKIMNALPPKPNTNPPTKPKTPTKTKPPKLSFVNMVTTTQNKLNVPNTPSTIMKESSERSSSSSDSARRSQVSKKIINFGDFKSSS